MKKIILVLLTALPVLIVFFTAIGINGIIVEIKTHPVTEIEIDYEKLQTGEEQKRIALERGQTLDFREYISVKPSKASFDGLVFSSSQPEVVDVESGILTAKQYMRNSNPILIDVTTEDKLKHFATFNVFVNYPNNITDPIIDYIGFDLTSPDYGKYCRAEQGVLVVDKAIIDDPEINGVIDIFAGLVVGPWRAATDVIDQGVVTITSGTNVITKSVNYVIIGTGTATITLTYKGKTATLTIEVE